MIKKRYYGTFSLQEAMFGNLKREAEKRNFYDDRLLLHWKDILGEFSNLIQPCKIVFNKIDNNGITHKTLYCCTRNGQFVADFLYCKKNILERLNVYFGTEKSVFTDLKLKLLN